MKSQIIPAAAGTMAFAVFHQLSDDGKELLTETFEVPIVGWEINEGYANPIIPGKSKFDLNNSLNSRIEYGLIVAEDSIVDMSGCGTQPFTRVEFVEFVSEGVLGELQAKMEEWRTSRPLPLIGGAS